MTIFICLSKLIKLYNTVILNVNHRLLFKIYKYFSIHCKKCTTPMPDNKRKKCKGRKKYIEYFALSANFFCTSKTVLTNTFYFKKATTDLVLTCSDSFSPIGI